MVGGCGWTCGVSGCAQDDSSWHVAELIQCRRKLHFGDYGHAIPLLYHT